MVGCPASHYAGVSVDLNLLSKTGQQATQSLLNNNLMKRPVSQSDHSCLAL
jgi:hypothetical protein